MLQLKHIITSSRGSRDFFGDKMMRKARKEVSSLEAKMGLGELDLGLGGRKGEEEEEERDIEEGECEKENWRFRS